MAKNTHAHYCKLINLDCHIRFITLPHFLPERILDSAAHPILQSIVMPRNAVSNGNSALPLSRLHSSWHTCQVMLPVKWFHGHSLNIRQGYFTWMAPWMDLAWHQAARLPTQWHTPVGHIGLEKQTLIISHQTTCHINSWWTWSFRILNTYIDYIKWSRLGPTYPYIISTDWLPLSPQRTAVPS